MIELDLLIERYQQVIGILPIIWLVVICVFDLRNDFSLKVFFCGTVDEIEKRREDIRGERTNWECLNLKGDYRDDKCPIFYSLKQLKRDFDKCPGFFDAVNIDGGNKKEKDLFWTTIRNGFLRNNQAVYF